MLQRPVMITFAAACFVWLLALEMSAGQAPRKRNGPGAEFFSAT
jgi:hypothetical protein